MSNNKLSEKLFEIKTRKKHTHIIIITTEEKNSDKIAEKEFIASFKNGANVT